MGASNDPLEQEADRIADEVSASRRSAWSRAPRQIHRFSGHSAEQLDAAPASVDHALARPGRPLDNALRQEMEQRFGHDFSRVQVHSDVVAEQSALEVNAHAYTAGRDIVFGAGRFAPTTHEGRRLIAHELTHVVQQRNAMNGWDDGGQPLTFLIQRQTKSEDLPGSIPKPTPPPLALLKIFSANRGSFSRFSGMEFQRESHAKDALSQTLEVKEGGIYWTFTFVINRTTGEFFVRQRQNETQIVNHYRGRLSEEGDGSPKKPAKALPCDEAKQSAKYAACIQPVLIARDDGKNSTSVVSFNESKAIWAKCCVTLSVNAAKTVNKTAYRTLDESKDSNPTKEQKDLFKDSGSSSCIQVFVPADFAQDGKTGKDISGGGATYDYGTANPKIVVVEGAAGEVVAHEIGHALGHLAHDANATVMKPTSHYNVANKSNVSGDVCKNAKKGSALTKSGTDKDCCMSF